MPTVHTRRLFQLGQGPDVQGGLDSRGSTWSKLGGGGTLRGIVHLLSFRWWLVLLMRVVCWCYLHFSILMRLVYVPLVAWFCTRVAISSMSLFPLWVVQVLWLYMFWILKSTYSYISLIGRYFPKCYFLKYTEVQVGNPIFLISDLVDVKYQRPHVVQSHVPRLYHRWCSHFLFVACSRVLLPPQQPHLWCHFTDTVDHRASSFASDSQCHRHGDGEAGQLDACLAFLFRSR